MSTYHRAHLAYGYDLGYTEKHEIEEVDKYGSLDLPWIKRDSEGYVDESLIEAFTRKLYQAIPGASAARTRVYEQDVIVEGHYGIKILEHGWVTEGDMPSFALIAYQVDCDGGEVGHLDLPHLISIVGLLKADEKLSRALEILEITPNQKRPGWLLLASR